MTEPHTQVPGRQNRKMSTSDWYGCGEALPFTGRLTAAAVATGTAIQHSFPFPERRPAGANISRHLMRSADRLPAVGAFSRHAP
jgi:hypothetical protein